METVRDKLDRLNDLAEEQIQNTESFSEEMRKINDTESALAIVVKESTSNLLGGLFFAGAIGLTLKAREFQLQQDQIIKEAKKDFLEENKEEIEEEISKLLKDRVKTKELVELHFIWKCLKPHMMEIADNFRKFFDVDIVTFSKDRTGLEIISEILKQSLEEHKKEFANEIERETELLLKNKYKVKKIVKLHINEEFLENFEM